MDRQTGRQHYVIRLEVVMRRSALEDDVQTAAALGDHAPRQQASRVEWARAQQVKWSKKGLFSLFLAPSLVSQWSVKLGGPCRG